MLQQTQVDTVIPYYHRFLSKFPTFSALAKAPLDHVLKQWEGLGYYSRARNLYALAKVVSGHLEEKLPSIYEDLIKLPGIGRYTAGAVLSIAFQKNYPVVDGNVQRVLSRYFGIRDNVGKSQTQKRIWGLATSLVPEVHAGDYNQALMELGALICVPRQPKCSLCPVRSTCWARKQGLQDKIPIKKKKAAVPHFDIGAGVIWRKGQILISQRPLKGLLGGLWEFPGGKQERGETLPQCVKREIKEELSIDVQVGKKLAKVDHAYSHFKITLHAFHCTYLQGRPRALGVHAWKWVWPKDLDKFAFPAANQPVIRELLK